MKERSQSYEESYEEPRMLDIEEVGEMLEAKYPEWLTSKADAQQIHVADTREQAIQALVSTLVREGTKDARASESKSYPAVQVQTEQSKEDFNRRIQDERLRKKELGRESIKIGSHRFHVRDRIYIPYAERGGYSMRGDKHSPDESTGFGTITGIDKLTASVIVEMGECNIRRLEFDLNRLVPVDLNTSTYKSLFLVHEIPSATPGYAYLTEKGYTDYRPSVSREYLFLEKSAKADYVEYCSLNWSNRAEEPQEDWLIPTDMFQGFLFVDRKTEVPEYQEIIEYMDQQREQQRTLETRQEEEQPKQEHTRKRGLKM